MGERVAIILGMGLGTYVLRVVPLLLAHRVRLSRRMIRWFQFVSFSVIASFVWFGLTAGTLSPPGFPIPGLRVVAWGLTIAVAAWTRNAMAGMVAGVVAAMLLTRGAS
ncbi:MAG: AzlD domain-containing protein [candidate division NC10 bacterium]|nr:AzlD domain-containing protein [candidate division NC10 bacterium]